MCGVKKSFGTGLIYTYIILLRSPRLNKNLAAGWYHTGGIFCKNFKPAGLGLFFRNAQILKSHRVICSDVVFLRSSSGQIAVSRKCRQKFWNPHSIRIFHIFQRYQSNVFSKMTIFSSEIFETLRFRVEESFLCARAWQSRVILCLCFCESECIYVCVVCLSVSISVCQWS